MEGNPCAMMGKMSCDVCGYSVYGSAWPDMEKSIKDHNCGKEETMLTDEMMNWPYGFDQYGDPIKPEITPP